MAAKKPVRAAPVEEITPPIEESPLSSAKSLQARTLQGPESEQRLPATLRDEKSFEYHLDLARSVINAIIDPDIPDTFIEVPCPITNTRRFLHTSYIKEIDVRGMQ